MSYNPSAPDPVLDLYNDINGVAMNASLRKLRPKLLNIFQIHVNNKIEAVKQSGENGETIGGHFEKLWASIPVDHQAEASAALSDVLDGVLALNSTSSFDRRLSSTRNVTPVRVYRQSSSRLDLNLPRQASTRINFGDTSPAAASSEVEMQEKLDQLRTRLEEAAKAKRELETELNIAKEYVKVANLNIQATNLEREQLRGSLAAAENTIEALESKQSAAQELVGGLQRVASEAESYSKYLAERNKEVSARLDEEEQRNEELTKSLEESQAREQLLAAQLKEALARNNVQSEETKDGRRSLDAPPAIPSSRGSVAATAMMFEKIKAENLASRRVSEERRISEVKETREGVLEFPARRISSSTNSPTPALRTNSRETSPHENFASAKDMWKRRESQGNRAPVLPPGYLKEKKSDSGKETSILPLPEAEESPKNSVKNFWKQRDSLSNKQAIFPSEFKKAASIARIKSGEDGTQDAELAVAMQPKRRLSLGAIAIPVVDIQKENGSKDAFEFAEASVSIPDVLRRASVDRTGSPAQSPTSRRKSISKSGPPSPFQTTPPGAADIQAATPSTANVNDLSVKVTPADSIRLNLSNDTAADFMTPSVMSPNFDAYDPDRVFDDTLPIVLIEIGETESRVGLWNIKKKCFEMNHACPTVVAGLIRGGGTPHNAVKGANIGSDPMYQKFREISMFVGKDAWYCCFDHPDAGLRGLLELENLFSGGRIRNIVGMFWLINHCLSKALPLDAVWPDVQILFSYNVACDRRDLTLVTRQLFQHEQCGKICFLDEAGLTARGTGFPSGLIVDIGTSTTKVQPVYEHLTMRAASGVTKVGGEHCTAYLESLLQAQKNGRFSSQLPRRRKQIARQMKHKYAFVCDSFEQYVADFGEFSFETVNVMAAMGTNAAAPKTKQTVKANRNTGLTSKIQVKEATSMADGSVLTFTMDIERFYCTEILFKPDLFEDCKNQVALPALILRSVAKVDEIVRKDVCEYIILSGKSSLLPGLIERLRRELQDGMSGLGVPEFQIVVAEENGSPSAVPSASWKGADLCVRRATDPFTPFNIEQQYFVTAEDYEEQGQTLEPNIF